VVVFMAGSVKLHTMSRSTTVGHMAIALDLDTMARFRMATLSSSHGAIA